MKFFQTLTLLVKAIRKSPTTVVKFAFKRFNLACFRATGYWEYLSKRSKSDWNDARVNQWMGIYTTGKLLFGPKNLDDFKAWVLDHPEWLKVLSDRVAKMHQGEFTVFDQAYQFSFTDMPWTSDWRYQYNWPRDYFLNYHFYGTHKPKPYDIKYPWELSRMGFMLPLAQIAALKGDFSLIEFIIDDWHQKNPLGYTINWEPMTCAIHGISLCLAVQMIAGNPAVDKVLVGKILRQIALQGEFLSKNIEDSIVHHNHYSSNLSGLLVMGFTLKDVYPPARRWFTYASRRISKEVLNQFLQDGVNFEKSISYHRLVTEFYLLSLITLDRAGETINPEVRKRIENACGYVFYYTRADGLAPNLGDNDGAWLIAFDPWSLRDHSSLVSLASVYFHNSKLKSSSLKQSSSIVWLLGGRGDQQFNSLLPDGDHESSHFFEAGGILTSRRNGNSLIADFGEVGNHGSGGHGHNDTFSFELALSGYAIIEDSGSPTYTGDIHQMMLYASTSHHNTLKVDQAEMATMPSFWRISDEAHPFSVTASLNDRIDEISGEHAGYTRLEDPVRHQRKFAFDKSSGRLHCQDILLCHGKHRVERFFWFNPDLQVSLERDTVRAMLPHGGIVRVQWNDGAIFQLETKKISPMFGMMRETTCLVLTDDITGKSELEFSVYIEPEKK